MAKTEYNNMIKNLGLLGVGVYALTKEKAEKFVKDLEKSGELSEKEGKKLVNKLIQTSEKRAKILEKKIDKSVNESLKKVDRDFDAVDALDFMIKTGLDALPVMDGDEIVGQVEINTILKEMTPEGNVFDYMTPDPITVTSDTSVSKARSVMRNYGIHRLIVSDDEKHIDGIITASDIVRKVLVPVERKTRGDMTQKKESMYGAPIKGLMTKNVVSISPNESAASAVELMVKKDLKALPVLEGTEVVGIVTKRAIAKELVPSGKRGVWVRLSGTDELDYFAVSLIRKVVRHYVERLGRRGKFDEIEINIKSIKGSEYEIKIGLIKEGRREMSRDAVGWDPVATVAEALRKVERGIDE